MIDINVTLFIQMANFLVFLILMNFVLYRPIRRIVAERKKLISEKQEGIESLEAQARAALQEYDSEASGIQDNWVLREFRNSRPRAMSRRRSCCAGFRSRRPQRFRNCAQRFRRISRSLERISSTR